MNYEESIIFSVGNGSAYGSESTCELRMYSSYGDAETNIRCIKEK